MILLVHVLAVLARWRFLLIPVFLLVAYFGPAKTRWLAWTWRVGIVLLGVAFVIGGPFLRNRLIAQVGEPAVGRVVNRYATVWSNNDDTPAMASDVLLREASGRIAESKFDDDALNLYPYKDYAKPNLQDVFDVRYLRAFPQDFVILTNDESAWSEREHCYTLASPLQTAKNRFMAARGAEAYRGPYIAAIDAYLKQGCAFEERGKQDYLAERARVVKGDTGDGY